MQTRSALVIQIIMILANNSVNNVTIHARPVKILKLIVYNVMLEQKEFLMEIQTNAPVKMGSLTIKFKFVKNVIILVISVL